MTRYPATVWSPRSSAGHLSPGKPGVPLKCPAFRLGPPQSPQNLKPLITAERVVIKGSGQTKTSASQTWATPPFRWAGLVAAQGPASGRLFAFHYRCLQSASANHYNCLKSTEPCGRVKATPVFPVNCGLCY